MALMRIIRPGFRLLAEHRTSAFVIPRSFCTENVDKAKETTTTRKKSGNDIRLIGRVKNEVVCMQNGFNSFHVRTATKSLGTLIGVTHNIKAKDDIVATPTLTDNDLVYVTGEIAYERVPNGEKFISVPHIFAKQIVRMENDNESDSLEQLEKESTNEVKLLGQIGSNISDENATIFSVVTNTDLNTLLKTDIFSGDWHRILVLDDTLREFVRTHLKITDRLLINGEIIYNKFELNDGNFVSVANILARRIQKLQQFKEEQPDSAQSTQATVEQ